MQMTLQELNPKSFQKLTATASAFRARLSALLEIDEASKILEELCFLKSCGWLKNESLVYFSPKMLKDFLTTRGGRTFGIIISTMDELGYDVEWQVLNSANFGVPQNRERVFIIGHFRGRSKRKIFPIRDGAKEANELQRQHIGTITTRTGESQGVGTYVAESEQPAQNATQVDTSNIAAIPALTPDRVEKGIANTLDTSCAQGVLDGYRIRKLTPRECFRLQGFPDKYFDRAAAVNSDSQLYKQAGNSVTVNVIYEMARRLR